MPVFAATAEVDPNDVRSFEIIPPGWYNAEMVDSEIKAAKSGSGEYVSLQFALLDPPHVNRRVFVTLNLWNASAEAVRIANQQRLELLTALGRPNAQTTEELYGIPVCLKVAVREDRSGQYEPRNEVKGFKPATAGTAAAPAGRAAPAAQRAAAPAPAARKPWEK